MPIHAVLNAKACSFSPGRLESSVTQSSDSDSSNDSDGRDSSIQTLNNSISRGGSIVQIRQRTVNVNFDIVETKITGGPKKHVVSRILLY